MNYYLELEECTSTNDYIREHLAELNDNSVITAKLQTSGKGRRGHIWEADSGMLPISILLKNPLERDTITARVGLAVCCALESVTGFSQIGIKWPNDIIVSGKKVCGILCECSFLGDCVCVICGIGVNVSQNEVFFGKRNLPNAASLFMLSGNMYERSTLIKTISENVNRFAAMPFSQCIGDFRSRVINLGKVVRLVENNSYRTAKAIDIAPNGFLICEDGNGRFEVGSGEVSVRGENGYI